VKIRISQVSWQRSLGAEEERIHSRLFRAWYKGWESIEMKSTGEDWFVASLTAKYGGLKFHDIDARMNGFSSAVIGFTLEDNC
jgi:allantoicase